ncbi:hypothetical protein D3C80_870680 [compost metagenome]
MVTIAQHHARHAFAHRGQPARIVGQTAHRHHPVRFNIRFVHHVQSIPIAQRVPQRMVRVMRAAHGVKVVLFHQLNVTAHGGFVHHLPVFRMVLMAVDATDQQRFSVHF